MANIYSRLDQIIPKIKEDKFIQGRGLGNEISFYIFDYDPEDELIVRNYIKHIKKEFSLPSSNRRIIEFDLYKMMIDLAKEMGIFDVIFEKEEKEGKDALYRAMQHFTEPRIFLEKIKEEIKDHNVIFITGVGKAYPFIRSHNILNNLQEVIEGLPVIMFFPGVYDGQSLRLFGSIKDDNYYRAFRLVDRK
jgi:hypothetical protein